MLHDTTSCVRHTALTDAPAVERLRQVEHSREDVLEAERRLLSRVLAALKESSPGVFVLVVFFLGVCVCYW